MAKVQVLNVAVLDNPSPFGNPFQFEITFECMEDLAEGECWLQGNYSFCEGAEDHCGINMPFRVTFTAICGREL